MYFWSIWQTYSTGITKKEFTNVEIQEQTASLRKKSKKCWKVFIPCFPNSRTALQQDRLRDLQRAQNLLHVERSCLRAENVVAGSSLSVLGDWERAHGDWGWGLRHLGNREADLAARELANLSDAEVLEAANAGGVGDTVNLK